MISCKNIEKYYGKLHVLKDINFEIEKGEIVSILGSSGAGKSTLLQVMGTLSRPDKGEIMINGINVRKLKDKKISEFRNKNIGFVFQFHHLLPEFNALENVCIPAYMTKKSKKETEDRAKEILEYLQLGHRLDHKPNEMSGGEQQRVAIARALINNPAVIFADEPTGNLDSRNTEELYKLFNDLRETYNQTFVIVTHNKELANEADRKLFIKDGRISS